MDIETVKQASTAEQARQYAMEWQQWQATQAMTWGDVQEWNSVFTELAERFDLHAEFTENGII